MTKKIWVSLLFLFCIMQINAYEFCDNGVVGENNLRIISIDDMLINNAYEWNWKNGDEIEIEIRVENRKDESENYEIELVFVKDDKKIRITDDEDNLNKEVSLSGGDRKSVSFTFEVKDSIDTGEYEMYVKLYANGNEEEECVEDFQKVSIKRIEICEDEADKDDLEFEEITDNLGDNEDKWDWKAGEEVDLSVRVNNKNYEQRDFDVELILLDEANEEVSLSTENEDILKNLNLNKGESSTLDFSFTLPRDLEKGDYTLYAKIYDSDNENICTSLRAEDSSNYAIIRIEGKEKDVAVTKVEGPKEIEKGSTNTYTAYVTNYGIGSEKRVMVTAYNYKIDLNQNTEILDLGEGETKSVSFNIEIPDNTTIDETDILFYTKFDYDSKKGYLDASDKKSNLYYNIELTEKKFVETAPTTEETKKITEEKNDLPLREENVKTTITGSVVNENDSDSGFSWGITFIILLCLGSIGFFAYKRIENKEKPQREFQPRVTRRYVARLDSSDL